jgi:hypothetical protein
MRIVGGSFVTLLSFIDPAYFLVSWFFIEIVCNHSVGFAYFSRNETIISVISATINISLMEIALLAVK